MTASGSTFNILSGTSMAAPHLGGIASRALTRIGCLLQLYQLSAIMTTVDKLDHEEKPIADEYNSTANLYAIGAGHVNPSKANKPGLVYNQHPSNIYINYLCGLGYTDRQVTTITLLGQELSRWR